MLVDTIKNAVTPKPSILNLLWRHNLLDAALHITPWRLERYGAGIVGPSSKYFTDLIDLGKLPLPRPSELQTLIEYALRCPHTISAIDDLLLEGIPKTLGLDYPTRRRIIGKLLMTFADLGSTDGSLRQAALDTILALERERQLLQVIHTLLGMLPQYDFAMGVELENKARVISPATKKKAWDDAAKYSDSATSVFMLLSLVESLQWPSNDFFYVIPNLYRFLAGEDAYKDIPSQPH